MSLTLLPLRARLPLNVVVPVPVIVPAAQVASPLNRACCVPSSVPPFMFSVVNCVPPVLLTLAVPLLLNEAAPPLVAAVPLKVVVPPLKLVLAALKLPATVLVPLLNTTEPALFTDEAACSVCPPSKPSVVPAATVKLPLLVPPPVSSSEPAFTATTPVPGPVLVLLNAVLTVVAPAPLLV